MKSFATAGAANAVPGGRIVHSAMGGTDNNLACFVPKTTRLPIELNRHMGTTIEEGTRLAACPECKGRNRPVGAGDLKSQREAVLSKTLEFGDRAQALPIRRGHQSGIIGLLGQDTQTPSRDDSTAQALASQRASSGTDCASAPGSLSRKDWGSWAP